MDTLPLDVYYSISKYLKNHDKLQFISTCKNIHINRKYFIQLNLNRKNSLKYYRDKKFRALISNKVVNTLTQLELNLTEIYINKPHLLSNINGINLTGCRGLNDITPLHNIYSLNLSCTDIDKIIILKNVKYLNLSNTKIENIENIKFMNNLYFLSLSRCNKIIKFNYLENISILDVSYTFITNEDISTLENVNSLNISECKKVTEVQVINKLKNLKKLKFSSYRNYIEDFNLIKNIKIIDTRSPSFY